MREATTASLHPPGRTGLSDAGEMIKKEKEDRR